MPQSKSLRVTQGEPARDPQVNVLVYRAREGRKPSQPLSLTA